MRGENGFILEIPVRIAFGTVAGESMTNFQGDSDSRPTRKGEVRTRRFRLARRGVVLGVLLIAAVLLPAPASATPYFNGFETDTAGWCDLTASGFFPCDGVDRGTINRVLSTVASSYTNSGGYAAASCLRPVTTRPG